MGLGEACTGYTNINGQYTCINAEIEENGYSCTEGSHLFWLLIEKPLETEIATESFYATNCVGSKSTIAYPEYDCTYESKQCVDGYCCDSACDLPDQSCNMPGKEGICTPKYHIVNQTDPACTTGNLYYSTIQSAVNAASSGDDVIVCPGTYNEWVDVFKSLTIRSNSGNPLDTIVNRSGSGDYAGFEIDADNVNISGFTVTGFTGYTLGIINSGILVYQSEHANISNNNLINNEIGIKLKFANYSIVENNNISSNADYGIWLGYNSNNNTVRFNIVSGNRNKGIALGEDDTVALNNIIEFNNIFDPVWMNFFNGQTNAVEAKYNWWGTTTCSLIDSKIYDDDESSFGKVDFSPPLDGPYPTGSPVVEICDGIDNDCDGVIDEEPEASASCPLCQNCSLGSCSNVQQGTDPKDDCPGDLCVYDYCDGNGACENKPDSTDCGICASCDGLGSCVGDLTQDEDCDPCWECSGLSACSYVPTGQDPKNDCMGNCDYCCSGSCVGDNLLCTGDCDYCSGSGNNYSCAPDESICEAYKCSDCIGSGTSFSCTYDQTEDEDCPATSCPDGCGLIPDNNPFTWDYADDVPNECSALDACTQNQCQYQHQCHDNDANDGVDGNLCGAECDQDIDCQNKCVGDVRYYSGTCDLISSCNCSYSTEDCNNQDGWVDTGNTQWVDDTDCTEKEQKEQAYSDYYCSESPSVACYHSNTSTQWVDTGNTRNKADETPCGDEVCDACYSGVCTAQTGETGVGCTDDCYDCNAGSCTATTEEDDGSCADDCDSCVSGTCTVRSPNDNTEVVTTCYYCDGSQATSQPYSGETGVGCTADCYDCDAGSCNAMTEDNDGSCNDDCNLCVSGVCTDRATCDSTECSAEEYCNVTGGDCKGLEQDSYVCESCFNYNWTGNSGNLNCCGNGALEDNPYEIVEVSCSDGTDNDCDDDIDVSDTDCWACTPGEQRSCPNQVGVCSGSNETCNATGQWPGCDVNEYNYTGDYENPEVSCDNLDNDCDGTTDGMSQPCGSGDCAGTETCTTGVWGDCSSSGSSCEDGLFCTTPDTCTAGVCSGPARDCSAYDDQCNEGLCDEDLDTCYASPINEGLSCDDSLWCNVGETCQSGTCTGGSARDCSDGVGCTDDSCDEDNDECDNTPNDGLCPTDTICADYYCDQSLDCQVNYEPSTTECRASAGMCDLAENCTGTSVDCPSDAKSTDLCRASTGECDIAEYCDGVNDDCPADAFEPQGTECGSFRDCPPDACNGYFVEFYPDDGHDTCDGNGNCVEYSCALQNSYCTDNDHLDGINTLECGAECDQNTDCLTGQCNLATCTCVQDTTPPQYSNIIEPYPDPSEYSSTATYTFKINWTDNLGVNEVILEMDGVNYSYKAGEITKVEDTYSKTFSTCTYGGGGGGRSGVPVICSFDPFIIIELYKLLTMITVQAQEQSCLSTGTHNYTWYASDMSNNWNSTEPLDFTINAPDPLIITITSPKNTTYSTNSVDLTYSIYSTEPLSWKGYSLDNQSYVTLTGSTVLTGLSEGSHNVIVFANNTLGVWNYSELVYFTVSIQKPDLIVEDIWTSGSTIYYRIRNQGNANSGYSYSRLYVDGYYKTYDYVPSLTANAYSNEYFSYSWICSGYSDSIQVCADGYGYVSESNEYNNCRTEIFNCPTTCTCTAWMNTYDCCPGSRWPYLSSYWTRTCTPSRCDVEVRCVSTRFCWV
jgi:parallel beta-helix repeat protein